MEWLHEQLIPLEWYREMRTKNPLSYDEGNGVWSVFAYADVKAIHSDYERFSSQFSVDPPPDQPIEASILRRDPPQHKLLRSIVTQAFTPRIIERMAERIEAIAHRLLDQVVADGQMDVVHDYAAPLPIIVIAEMLGIPEEDRTQFKQWSDSLVSNDYERYMQCQEEMAHYFSSIASDRRLKPQDDLISHLVRAQSEGVGLSELELIGFCILLLVAGNETTTNLLSSSVLCLDSMSELQSKIRANRELIPSTIEEVLRYCSPVQRMERKVKQDVEYRGHYFKAGQTVVTHIGSANHDERVFADPDQFDIFRSPNQHLAFGHGIHFCLGAPLARLEAKIALNVLFDRLPKFRRSKDTLLERQDSWLIFGVKQLPVHWN